MNYFPTALKGASWFSALRVIVRGVMVIKIAVLARLLTPAQFGEFGIATIVLGLLEIFTETGINVFLLQEKDRPEHLVNTAWTISIARGVIISSLILLSTPLVVNFFRSPHITPLILLTSLVPLIRGFINPLIIKLQKDLRYTQEFALRTGIVVIETGVIVGLAAWTGSVYSFVWGLVVSAVVEVAASHWFIRPRPRLGFDRFQARQILTRGKWITGYGILEYIYTQLDNIVVGRLLGQSALGIYQNAYKLSVLPLSEIGEVFYKVNFPIFVRLVAHPKRLWTAAVKAAGLLIGLLVVSSLALYYLAEPLINLALGANWQQTIPVVKLLACLGLLRGLGYAFNSVFLARQQQRRVTIITATSVGGLAISIVPLVNSYGLIGAAYAALVGAALALLPASWFIWTLMKELSRD